MTEEQGFSILCDFTGNLIKQSGWWIFNKRNLITWKTRILEPYEKIANLPLPPSVIVGELTIDHRGISTKNARFEWSEISATAIQSERFDKEDREGNWIYERILLCCLHDGKILQFPIPDLESFKGLFGHFIEQYKLSNI